MGDFVFEVSEMDACHCLDDVEDLQFELQGVTNQEQVVQELGCSIVFEEDVILAESAVFGVFSWQDYWRFGGLVLGLGLMPGSV
jgi:hypothetical protein